MQSSGGPPVDISTLTTRIDDLQREVARLERLRDQMLTDKGRTEVGEDLDDALDDLGRAKSQLQRELDTRQARYDRDPSPENQTALAEAKAAWIHTLGPEDAPISSWVDAPPGRPEAGGEPTAVVPAPQGSGQGLTKDDELALKQMAQREDDRADAERRQRLRQLELRQQLEDGGIETGHYDDGHGFGWSSRPTEPSHAVDPSAGARRWRRYYLAMAVAALMAVLVAIVLFGRGGSSTTREVGATHDSRSSQSSSSSSSATSSSSVATFAPNTVFDGCIEIAPEGATTFLRPTFTVSNPTPGEYTAAFAKGPTGAVSGTGDVVEGTSAVTVSIQVTRFGVYDQLTLTAPDGAPVALGPIQLLLPLDLDATTDKPNGCNASGLQTPPIASSGPPAPGVESGIRSFLADFERALRVNDVDFLVSALDPAVIARYSAPVCTNSFHGVAADPTAAFSFQRVASGPEPYVYESDGQSTTVQNTYTVDVARTADGQTSDASIHLSVDGSGRPHWFTDCTR